MTNPSCTFVNDACLSACKAIKLQSKQLMFLSSSYTKKPFLHAGESVLDTLTSVMKHLNDIQDCLNKTGNIMKIELDKNEELVQDDLIVVTKKEYLLLNAVFQEYSEFLTSNDFSIFSNAHDIHKELGLKCQDSGEK